jgi:hypothetical protein
MPYRLRDARVWATRRWAGRRERIRAVRHAAGRSTSLGIRPLFSAVLLLGLMARASASPPASTGSTPPTGTLSGTISLTTNNARGLAQIPAGSVITVWVECLGGNPNAQHFDTCDSRDVVVPANAVSVRYMFSGLHLGPVILGATASAMNRGPHHWVARLTAPPQGPKLAISSSAPHLVADISATGAYVPVDATADGTVPLGSEHAAIEMHRAVPNGPLPSSLPAGLQIVVYAAHDATQRPIATATATAAPVRPNNVSAPWVYEIRGLPLGTPLVIRLVVPAGATPALVYRHVDFWGLRDDPSCEFSAVPAPAASTSELTAPVDRSSDGSSTPVPPLSMREDLQS